MIQARHRVDPGNTGRAGFTLLEMAVVIAVLIILGAIALPNMRALIPRYRLNSAVKDLSQAAQLARLAAISHGRDYRICLESADSSPDSGLARDSVGKYSLQAWDPDDGDWDVLPVDVSGDSRENEGSYDLGADSGNHAAAGISIVGWTPLGGPGVGNADCLVFSPKGWIDNPNSDFDGGFIYVQFRNKYMNPQADIRTVRFSRGGATTILQGAHGVISAGSGGARDAEPSLPEAM